jgi:hypothetical protein
VGEESEVWVLFNDIRHWAHRSNLLFSLASPTFSTSLALPQVFLISHDYPKFQEKAPPPQRTLSPPVPSSNPSKSNPTSRCSSLFPHHQHFPTNSPRHPDQLALSRNHRPLPSNHHRTKKRPYTTHHDLSLPIAPRNAHLPAAVVAHQDDYLHQRPQEPNLSPG